MGIGIGSGDNRAVDAATHAIHNPLLEDSNIEGAKGILVNVTGGADLSLSEYEEILNIVNSSADPNVLIIAGMSIDESMGDSVQVTMIATGFKSRSPGVGAASGIGAAAATGTARKGDTLSLDEWNSVMNQGQNPPPAGEARDFSHLFGDSNLDVPAFLRQGSRTPNRSS